MFDKMNLAVIRADIDEALRAVNEKHGIQIKLGGISYEPNSFTAKLTAISNEVADAAPSGVNPKWVKDFLSNCWQWGFNKADLGRKVTYRNAEYVLAGARSRAQYPIVLERNGKFIAAIPELVVVHKEAA